MGTPGSKKAGEYVKKKLEESGAFDEVVIDEHDDILAHYPISRSVSVLSPTPYEAELNEPPNLDASTSSDKVIHPWIAYGPSGNATGEVLYINFGRTEDWEFLKEQGLDG